MMAPDSVLSFLRRFRPKPVPDDIFVELVGLMFLSLNTIRVMAVIHGLCAAAIVYRTRDGLMIWIAAAGVLVSFARVALSFRFEREVANAALTPAEARVWERRYAVWAYLSAACIGALSARILVFEEPVSHLLAMVLSFAYASGSIVRAAVRPIIAGIQVGLILFVPTIVVAFHQGTVYYATLLVLQILLMLGAWRLIKSLHQTILGWLLARHELRLAKEAAEEAKTKAEQGSVAKTEFLATMSHEIRTPLNGILGYTDLLLEDPDLTDHQRRQIQRISDAGAALLTVVNDILDFSRIEAGQVELDHQRFSPAALIDNTFSIVKAMADKKQLAMRVEVRRAVPQELVGDQNRLRQILLNLLNNAVKFTPAGEIVLRVDCEGVTETSCTLRFSVSDTGIGIPQDWQKHLFQRFSQLDGSIRRKFGGTGLGLAISKHLVELMGGEIGVMSVEGRGTTFWFTIDLAPAPEESESRTVSAEALPSGAPARILLVEDVPINQEIARAVLEAAGHQVDVVADGAEAIMAVQRAPYDLILMDIQMPVMDGITATQRVRALEHPAKDLPIIAMTANVLPQQIAQFRIAGMDDHVGKPFKRDELYAAVRRWRAGRTPAAPGAFSD